MLCFSVVVQPLTIADIALPGREPAPKHTPLLKLPTELLLQIYSHLGYRSALALSSTCRTFHRQIPNQPTLNPTARIARATKATFLFYAETFPQHRGNRVCYRCLRLKPFAAYLDTVRHAQAGSKPERYDLPCFACCEGVWERGLAAWPRPETVMWGGDEMRFCRVCWKWRAHKKWWSRCHSLAREKVILRMRDMEDGVELRVRPRP